MSDGQAIPGRRRFMAQLGLGAGALALGSWACAQQAGAVGAPVEWRGQSFDLTIARAGVNITGRDVSATLVNGSLPGPCLRWKEGEEVTIRVHNRLDETTSIHWHGILVPTTMDGVPGMSFDGIPPGGTFIYRFRVHQSGTYWYHAHSGMQEQTGVYGAIVVEPAGEARFAGVREHVVMLSDWTDEDPMRILRRLKVHSDRYAANRTTLAQLLSDAGRQGWDQALSARRMWNEMRMSPLDLADVSAMAYTYLVNGQTADGNWTGLFTPGETVRLRFINAAANTFFDVRVPGVPLTVIESDGQAVEPVTVDEFRFGPGETYDVLLQPGTEACTIFAQSMDRSGYVRATLAVRQGLSAAVPPVDAVQPLSMEDMMGSMGGQGRSMPVHHARSESGPGVDMRVDHPRDNLDDPGVGLRHHGRRVLTYADLRSLGGSIDTREPMRTLELHLTGNMERYQWSFDGVPFAESRPIHFRHGERLRIVLVNDTMMTHPMHLHGLWSELEDAQGQFLVRKHTIAVQPAQRIAFRVTADAPGHWAWHCHLMFHMDSGMFREVVVS